jgi:uncharacterized protein YjlB
LESKPTGFSRSSDRKKKSVPNNERLPLLLYTGVLDLSEGASSVESLFHKNDWVNSWRDGVYPRHHYHSTAHEVLGVYAGEAVIKFGGDDGPRLKVAKGDVVVIPAGVAHKRIRSSGEFGVVGAYPEGQTWDMCYGTEGERPEADRRISALPDPKTDPVYGSESPLVDHWLNRE